MLAIFAISLAGQLLALAPTMAEGLPRSVMVVDESGSGGPFYTTIFTALQSTLDADSRHTVSIYWETLDLSRFKGPVYQEALTEFLETKYRDRPVGVIVAVGAAALGQALRLRQDMWPDVPLVFTMVTKEEIAATKLPPGVTGLTIELKFVDMVRAARAVVPNLKRLAVVGDPLRDQVVFHHFADEIPAAVAAGGPQIIDLTGLPMDELRARVSALPDDSAIAYTSVYSDGEETSYTPAQVLAFISEVANRPIVVGAETFIGSGAVGGFVVLPSIVGEEAARLILRIIEGEPVSAIPIAEGNGVKPIFDWQQLRRWNVDDTNLPAGSEVRFNTPSQWVEYLPYFLGAGSAILLQGALINWLLYERRQRHHSEVEVRETMIQLAHLNRVATAGELSGSITHELTQPITGMIASASAAQRWLTAATPDLDNARTALAQAIKAGDRATDIIRGIRAMFKRDREERRNIDINSVIVAVLGLVEADLQRLGITLETRLSSERPIVNGDYVQLQQVILNLTVNAIESMSGTDPQLRALQVYSGCKDGEVSVAITDAGAGISPDHLNDVFKPLFTTKPQGMGMGLSICRSIVEAHRGKIWVTPGDQRGTVFQFVLPRSSQGQV